MELSRPVPKQQLPDDDDDDSSPPAYPRWILLEKSVRCEEDPDAKTAAHARISDGRPIRVSFAFAPPPAASRLRADIPGVGAEDGETRISTLVVAAHGDSVLLSIETRNDKHGFSSDCFVYSAGDFSRPPSLALLPPFCPVPQCGRIYMDLYATALLQCRADGELVVPVLDYVNAEDGDEEGTVGADLCLLRLRSGDRDLKRLPGEWELKRLPVLHDEGRRLELLSWETDAVVPVGDRFLCWVDYSRGTIFSDVRREPAPELRYVSLPVKPDLDDDQGRRRVCATQGGTVVRFVEVYPLVAIATWTLRTDDMTWHKDGLVDCDDLWSLASYDVDVVPCFRPSYPTVSLDGDPDTLCFMVQHHHAACLVEIDMMRMELRSIFRYGDDHRDVPRFVPSTISRYFNTPHGGPMSIRERRPRGPDIFEAPTKPLLKPTLPEKGPSMMLSETPALLCDDDVRRAYRVLACDEDRLKFIAIYSALPEEMRKDYWRLMTKMCSFDV